MNEHEDMWMSGWLPEGCDYRRPNYKPPAATVSALEHAVRSRQYFLVECLLRHGASLQGEAHLVHVLFDRDQWLYRSVIHDTVLRILREGARQRVPEWPALLCQAYARFMHSCNHVGAMSCLDWGAAPFAACAEYQDVGVGGKFMRIHRQLLERRMRYCQRACITLIGICGRWRRFMGGGLRDVMQSIVRELWQYNRRSAKWKGGRLKVAEKKAKTK